MSDVRENTQVALNSFLQQLMDAAIVLDPSGGITFMNPAAEQLTGWRRKEAERRQLSEVVVTVTEKGQDTPSSDSGVLREHAYLVSRDGRRIAVDISTTAIKEKNHDIAGFVVLIRNINSYKAAEEELSRSRAKYKELINSINETVWEANSETLLFTFVSKQAKRLLGYPLDSWIREPRFWLNHIHPADRERVLNLCTEGIRERKSISFQCRMIRADGATLWVRYLVTATTETDPGKLRGLILDITEEKNAESALRRLDKAVQTMQLGVTITDTQRKILYTNPAEAAMHGYRSEELIGKDISVFIPPGVRAPMSFSEIKQLKRYKRESINKRTDGTLFPVQLTSDLITDETGNPIGIVTICEDISEQKSLQEELRKTHDELERRVQERTEELKHLADQRKRLLELSQSMIATLELDRVVKRIILTLREVLTFDVCGIYWTDEKRGVLRPSIVVGEEKYWDWEIPMDRGIAGTVIRSRLGELVNNSNADPRSIYPPGFHPEKEHLICIPIQVKGEIHGIFNVSRKKDPPFTQDEFELVYVLISHAAVAIENARLFEQMKTSEGKYRSLFEESQDVVFISSPEGKFVDINPAGVRMFGYANRQELLNVDIGKEFFISSADREKYLTALNLDGFVRNYEITLRKRSGEKVNVLETTNAVRNEKGEITAYRGIMRDITEEKKLQEKLRDAEVLEKMGRLVSGVAHEVRNPLTSILAVTELLERDFKENEKYRPFIAGIRLQVNRLSALMRDLLQLGKPVEESRISRASLLQLCSSTMELWKQTDPKRAHPLILHSGQGEDPYVRMDSARMQQVLLNLLDNASQHSPADSEIRIIVEQSAGTVAVKVEDRGTGIAGQNFMRLFEPFFTTRKGGVGLGLSLVKHFVELHGGKITAWNNKPQAGCTFEMTLPLSE